MSMKFKNPIEVDGYVSAEYADLSTTTSHSVSVGEIAWNATDGTFDMGLIGGVTLQAGQEMHIYGKATEAISNGDAVMFGGVQGEHLLLSKADAATINANPEYFIGVSTQDFATNDFGYVTVFGKVRTLNTTGYSLGAVLYYDSTTSTDGKLTATEPSAPNAKIIVAAVVKVHATQGVLMVRPHIMPTLSEIQDVNTSLSKTTPVNTDNLLLQDSADQSIWKKLSWSNLKATLKTYFDTIYQSVLTNPITGTGTSNYLSKFTGTTSLGNSQVFDNGTNVGVGTASPVVKFQVGNGTGLQQSYISGGGYDLVLGAAGGNFLGFATQTISTIFNTSSTPLGIATNGSQPLIFGTGATERMRINSSGNVGIGTTSPSVSLQVSKSTTNGGTSQIIENTATSGQYTQTSLFLKSFDGSSVSNGALFMQTASTFSYQQISANQTNIYGLKSGGIRLATVSAPIIFANGASDADFSTEKMRIASSGNVGIGTSSPSKKLDVNGDALINGLTVGRGAGDLVTNTVLGYNALTNNISGYNNVSIGTNALNNNQYGINNVAIGYYALPSSEATNCIAIGAGAAYFSSENGILAIGTSLSYKPDGNPLTANELAIAQQDSNLVGLPQFYSPDKKVVSSYDTIAILNVSASNYAALFVDYMIDDLNGNLRAGTIKAIFKSDLTDIKWDDNSTDSIGVTSDYVFNIIDAGGGILRLNLYNSNPSYTVYCRITSRLLMRII